MIALCTSFVPSREPPAASCSICTGHGSSPICACRRATGLRHYVAIEKASTVYGSTTDGGSAFVGATAMLTTWRSSIIIEDRTHAQTS